MPGDSVLNYPNLVAFVERCMEKSRLKNCGMIRKLFGKKRNSVSRFLSPLRRYYRIFFGEGWVSGFFSTRKSGCLNLGRNVPDYGGEEIEIIKK